MAKIRALRGREVFDSRGQSTISVELETDHGKGEASVPSGASVGAHEAYELRDPDGKGVSNALANIHDTIAAAVVGKEFDQQELDTFLGELDGTSNKRRLGANTILGVSIAFARAQAHESDLPLYAYLGALDNNKTFSLPQPLFNILNGGKHVRQGIDIQECMLAPIDFESVRERVEVANTCVVALKSLLIERGYVTDMGDEGGFAPNLMSNEEALELLVSAIMQSGYTTDQIKIALDVAASSLYTDGGYVLKVGGVERVLDQRQMLEWYAAMIKTYPLMSIEDGFAEDDLDGFTALTKELGKSLCIVGDDLTVTNVERIHMAAEKRAVNACIIKPNQIGTITETLAAVRGARTAGWKIFASHRSGETEDTFIADLSVGFSCDYLKAGAPTRVERIVKYTRLMEIEAELL